MQAFLQHGSGNGPFRTEEVEVRVNRARLTRDGELSIFDVKVPGTGWRAIRYRKRFGKPVEPIVRANGEEIAVTVIH